MEVTNKSVNIAESLHYEYRLHKRIVYKNGKDSGWSPSTQSVRKNDIKHSIEFNTNYHNKYSGRGTIEFKVERRLISPWEDCDIEKDLK